MAKINRLLILAALAAAVLAGANSGMAQSPDRGTQLVSNPPTCC